MSAHGIFLTHLGFWLLAGVVLAVGVPGAVGQQHVLVPEVPVRNPGQMPLPPGSEIPHQRIRNSIGGVYSENITLFYRNSPYRVVSELVVEAGATMVIETGVQLYFDTGVGLKVWGTIKAVGNEFAHIQMLPFQQQLVYDDQFPEFKLIDGPSVRQGRLQAKFRDRWRGVCTQVTNWTSVDTGVACRSMGYSDGGFYRWFRRNNDTYPFVMPKPDCLPSAKNLWECEGFSKPDRIPLSENLCQGEDDIGIYCWGPPTFTGWARHWKGLQIFNSPYHFVYEDPDMVSMARESDSRLEFIDILYAGYDGQTRNATPALYIEGVPPIMNGLRVQHSARDGIYVFEPAGPVLLANSTIGYNRGHGLVVDNSTDGRVFVNMTLIQGNFGDGIWYRQRRGGINLVKSLGNNRYKRQSAYYEEERPRLEICQGHELPRTLFFPHLIRAWLKNGTAIDPIMPPPCWVVVSLPKRLPYSYTIQFLSIQNLNSEESGSRTYLLVCDGNQTFSGCAIERYRVPIHDGVFPQSVALRSSGNPIYIALDHDLGPMSTGRVIGDVDVLFKIHASVTDKAFYGLNVTNSDIWNNTGNGVQAIDVRDRTALSNVTVESNEGLAGFLIRDGAADIWVNDTSLSYNWGDGMNVSYAGGSININGSRFIENRWRGFAFHHNGTIPFWPLRQEIIIKGRPANNIFYPPTIFRGNFWGGVVVGNFCSLFTDVIESKVLINWVQFTGNRHHPAIDIFSCQRSQPRSAILDITGNVFESNSEVVVRVEPAVNVIAVINSNQFLNNNHSALLVRNARFPQLAGLPADVTIAKNIFKFNSGPYIISIGLNEDAPAQKLIFNQQNEVRENYVYNPFPFLKPRSTPYAAMVVSSSNVKIRRNCFKNPRAEYEIGTELMEHAKAIDARENNWGYPRPENFMNRIFDQFNRYSLASIIVNPFAAVCNQRSPHITLTQQYYRQFRSDSQPYVIGGTIFENHDLMADRYTVIDDLHVVPGAKLTVAPGTVLEFMDGIGMLVEGELIRADFTDSAHPVTFTAKTFELPRADDIRLVDEKGNDEVTAGRLEVFVDNQWGTVCNRSWTAQLAHLACNQLGLTMDPQYFENWRIFVDKGELPMVMDNIRCEEREFDLTRCRHDGVFHNVAAGCRATEVVGLRCAQPYWAGVRYSLLANPPTVTGQTTMHNWLIEKAGLFDFRSSTFAPALQIDWNYHTFHNITIQNNYFDGLDIVYNDLTKKPAIRDSRIVMNRRNGVKLRSVGITIEHVIVEGNQNAGFRFNPRVSAAEQRDIVSWLDRKEQPDLEANNVVIFPNNSIDTIQVFESQLNQRKFLVAKATPDCPISVYEPCVWTLEIQAVGHEYGLAAKVAVQIVNRAHNMSDEDAILYDKQTGRQWSARRDVVQFPIVSSGNRLTLKYTRSYGEPKLVLLVLFLDAQEYLDRFLHVYESVIQDNQYGISAVHYSNLTFDDGTVLNRHTNEKLWFQKVNFTRNSDAVVWLYSPQHEILPNTPIAEITWHIDNCSIHHNAGPIVDTHRDLFASANIFHWKFWSNTFANNSNGRISVHLPDTYNLLARQEHTFWMTENRFETNENFGVLLAGYYCFANISSNNFTDNNAYNLGGIMELRGMEKKLIMEHNRFYDNWGHWLVRVDTQSQSLRNEGVDVPSFIQYNYFQNNNYLTATQDYVDSWPRSYAVGVFGGQKVDVHFNRLSNHFMDFELVAGCTPHVPGFDSMNVTFNWWGPNGDDAIPQRIFDLDDWNTFTVAEYSPFFSSKERFNDFWWDWHYAQISYATYNEPSEHDLHGRMFQSKNLSLDAERWYQFPYYYRPFRPYRIARDLTIMPGATLKIENNVEVHIWPNVRILVLGDLIADATLWQPVRFLPINTTEALEQKGKIPTKYKRSVRSVRSLVRRPRQRITSEEFRHVEFIRKKRRAGFDLVYEEFPVLRRDDPYFQQFSVSLMANSTIPGRAGFLQIYNATTGETVPSCDRQFTRRNAMVVCRELGYDTQNVYHWLTPRWDYNPQIRLVKTYMEPRECTGSELRLDECNLRLTGNDSMWMCMDNEHFNYIHCGRNQSLDNSFIGNWGGITFAAPTLELSQIGGQDASVLRHIEIVGGGQVHNDSFQSAALQIIRRNPIIENVNVTNSSMHGMQIISPRDSIILARLNVSDNKGQGLSVLTTNLKAASATSPTPKGPMNLPYYAAGLLDICAAGKRVKVLDRILLYYKYDSFPVDCVKVFTSNKQKLGFRFLQVNLYGATNGLGRSDALSIYSDDSFVPTSLLHRFTSESDFGFSVLPMQGPEIAMHLRATAADGEYGFLAEISVLPSTPDARNVDEVTVRNSRFLNNDRGALEYRNTGEIGPSVIIEQCSVAHNGYFLFGNISTSAQAMELHLHNTLLLLFRANALWHNRGGLLVTAQSSSAVAQLNAVIKNSAFSLNSNSTTLAFLGNNYQRVTLLNNIITLNYALYFDTVLVQDMSANFTRNLFSNNTGLNTVDTHGYSRVSSDAQIFLHNYFDNNLALGHQLQYLEAFGYQPDDVMNEFDLRPRKKRSARSLMSAKTDRVRRQVLSQKGVSFDWWTHVGRETSRYRSTVLAGSSHQKFYHNIFNDPLNPYELTTSAQTQFDTGAIDARDNYWGYPGTQGVAAGKIRDQADFPFLIKVDYLPVLDSNTSLIEGDCPPGWFQAGQEEFKSCFLFVGAAMTYEHAVRFCEEIDAFIPILRNDDPRQAQLARRIDEFGQLYITDAERYNSMGMSFDIPFWVSSVALPSNQCGYMSSRSGSIGEQNCNNLFPFVCEKGTKPYQEPVLWRRDIILALVLLALLLLIIVLLIIGWCVKTKRRDDDFVTKKAYIRDSIRRQKQRTFANQHPINGGSLFVNDGLHKDRVKPIRAHEDFVPLPLPNRKPPPPSTLSGETFTLSTDRTTVTESTENTYSTPTTGTGTSRTGTTDSTDTYSELTYSTIPPPRPGVSMHPDPYSDAASFRPPPPGILRPMSRKATDLSTSSSTCTTCSGTYSVRSCTTCTSGRDSTITEESESSRSSTSSDTTLTQRPLLGRSGGIDPESSRSRASLATFRAESQQGFSTTRTAGDFFRGSGRPLLTPSRSNPSFQQIQHPVAPPPPPPTVPKPLPFIEEYSQEPGRRSRPPSWHNSVAPAAPAAPIQRGNVPVYKPNPNPNPGLSQIFTHSPTTTAGSRSRGVSPNPIRQPLPSRSLNDLSYPGAGSSLRRMPSGSTLETSM